MYCFIDILEIFLLPTTLQPIACFHPTRQRDMKSGVLRNGIERQPHPPMTFT
jgi:hypothetical protein